VLSEVRGSDAVARRWARFIAPSVLVSTGFPEGVMNRAPTLPCSESQDSAFQSQSERLWAKPPIPPEIVVIRFHLW
jgi:hypothetical protein